MDFITPEDISKVANNPYEGVIVAAKEARRLNTFRREIEKRGGEVPEEYKGKITTIALYHLLDGKITFEYDTELEEEPSYYDDELSRISVSELENEKTEEFGANFETGTFQEGVEYNQDETEQPLEKKGYKEQIQLYTDDFVDETFKEEEKNNEESSNKINEDNDKEEILENVDEQISPVEILDILNDDEDNIEDAEEE